MKRLYRFTARWLYRAVKIAGWVWPAAARFVRAREEGLKIWLAKPVQPGGIWFHVSSVGELEQVRPVVEALRQRSAKPVWLTYFSDSVPRLVRDWSFADGAGYLPLDLPETMEAFVRHLQPSLLVLNRYDLWPELLGKARASGAAVALINASTPPRGFWGWCSVRLRSELFAAITHWTYVDSVAAEQWEPVVGGQVRGLVTGNPRVDRAILRAEQASATPKLREILARWKHNPELTIVCGSTWEADETLVLRAFQDFRLRQQGASLILVPHEPEPAHLQNLERQLRRAGLSSVRFSALAGGAAAAAAVLVVDARGHLAELYGAGALAYVGGGFGRQIHSIIEPLAHHRPVAIGPHFARTPEAATLTVLGPVAAFASTGRFKELSHWWESALMDAAERRRIQEALRVFLQVHRGAGERIADFLAAAAKNC